MADTAVTYVICYDIPDDRRRNKVAACLEDFGDRVQYSVFEAVLPRRLFDKLLLRLRDIVDPDDDSLAIYRLCAACISQSTFIGLASSQERPGQEEVFIV